MCVCVYVIAVLTSQCQQCVCVHVGTTISVGDFVVLA